MGTWNTKINGNDTFQEIYQNYFDLYNQGQNPADISKQIQEDFFEFFNDYDDRNNSLFGLALAQWETKSLDPTVYKKVKEIIETDYDLEVWKGLGADDKIIEKRKKELDKFLTQISTEREKQKRRVRPKFGFMQVDLVNLMAPDNKKRFTVSEHFTNEIYKHTGSLMMWQPGVDKVFINGGGGSVLYFTGQGKNISAKWIDSETLEVTHDKNIEFTKQDERAYFCGDDIKIIYKPQ
ncbi:hypothetical protein [Pedobacter sandarakinus]|uniref:hypothetical protein n=1 Tax=Pedobacter sandarakinus TaxID=353156 RepID=UPI002245B836|nr:hypothetical protein [Pedobacter sandarakinus]MCX2575362.1 hypothetical protein [Pedobacter sandarakinus]